MKTYMVGGAVRDKLMGLQCEDRDWVVVGASETEMINLGFERVGRTFPVYLHPETREEYALARKEKKTGNKHIDFEVETDGVTLEEDLYRRDITINAIAFDQETGQYIDPYHGIAHIENKVIRHVSDAFGEDPLRVIRVARFAARYCDFTIAEETKELCKSIVISGVLEEISIERFYIEIRKALKGNNSKIFFETLFEFGVMEHVGFFKNSFSDFGTLNVDWELFRYIPEDLRLDIFFALLPKTKYHPTYESFVLGHALAKFKKSFSPTVAVELCTMLKANTYSKLFSSFQFLVMLTDISKMPIMTSIGLAFASVRSKEFTEEGVDLGKAMRDERINRVKKVMEFYNVQ